MTKNKELILLICAILIFYGLNVGGHDEQQSNAIPGNEARVFVIYESEPEDGEVDYVGNSDHWREYLEDSDVKYLRIDQNQTLDQMDKTWQAARKNVQPTSLPWWALTTGNKGAKTGAEFAQPDDLKALLTILKRYYDE